MELDLFATLIALLTAFGIASLMAMSLNIEYGMAGIPNFGKALFVSVGAYVTGLTYTRLLPLLAGQAYIDPCGMQLADALQLRMNIVQQTPAIGFAGFALTLGIAALVGGGVGYLAALITRRLKHEWYLALMLLVSGEIVRILARSYPPITCGSNGIAGIAQPFSFVGDPRLAGVMFALLTLALAAAVYWYSERLMRSPYGRLLRAVREDDHAARSLGKDVPQVRAQVLFIGSVIAAIAGVLFAVNLGFVSTNDYTVTLTMDVWVMVVLGGMGGTRGALLGALIVTLLERATAIIAIQLNMAGANIEFNYVRYITFGVLLVIMLRYRPGGLLPEPRATTDTALISRREMPS